MGAGTELAATVSVGILAGFWLDKVLKTGPWLVVLGAMAGMTLALYRLVRSSRFKP